MTILTFIKHSWTNSSTDYCQASLIENQLDIDTLVTISLVASACCKERR